MPVIIKDIHSLMQTLPLHDDMAVSFHHHLRNGDFVVNRVLEALEQSNVKTLTIHPSSIFPSYTKIVDLLKKGIITDISTCYINGPVADYLVEHGISGQLTMHTHGGRARAIMSKELAIDIAFIAAPAVDRQGRLSGTEGLTACGSLGYAVADLDAAKTTVLVTDSLLETLEDVQIDAAKIDFILVLDKIGDPQGIQSGTTALTTDPVGVKIAKTATQVIDALGIIKNGFNYQSGAGGISLLVTENIRHLLKQRDILAGFFSGGITGAHVRMLEEGLVKTLYDVQCFDIEAAQSLKRNKNHKAISANMYANPENPQRVIKDLDVVILGAAEIDLDFNVNVTTNSYNLIIGGSGGHSDTAEDAKVSIIVTPLMKARTPIIKQRVNTITTPGNHIDIVVTERGIAINPKRQDLIDKLSFSQLDIVTIEALQARAFNYTGIPKDIPHKGRKIGEVIDRHGIMIDAIYMKG